MAFAVEVIFRWRAGVAAAGLVALEALLLELVAAAADMEREGAARGGGSVRGERLDGSRAQQRRARDATGDRRRATGAGRASRRAARGESRRAGRRRVSGGGEAEAVGQVAAAASRREGAKRSPV